MVIIKTYNVNLIRNKTCHLTFCSQKSLMTDLGLFVIKYQKMQE